jgi:hypothetical protein
MCCAKQLPAVAIAVSDEIANLGSISSGQRDLSVSTTPARQNALRGTFEYGDFTVQRLQRYLVHYGHW